MMSETPEQPAIPPQPTEPPDATIPAVPKRPLSPIAAGLLGLILGAGLMGGLWAIIANSGPSKPPTFTLNGSFELTDSVTFDGSGGCRGRSDSGYDDIAEGTSVTVYGASGDVIATGELGNSKEDEYGTTCTFAVSVPDVPKGEKFYKVEVSHRGTVQLSAAEAEKGKLAASLG